MICLALSADGKTLAWGGYDEERLIVSGVVKLWDIAAGKERAVMRGHTSEVRSVAFAPDGKTLASGADQTVILWDVEAAKTQATLRGHRADVLAVAFSPDGRTLASSDEDGVVKLWDVPRRKDGDK